ncbi:MAG: hypothetical protein EOP05_02950 [Proteobacteria bacterium]|nr:MAG: hypothetical protein EOP05_02950 [Pseudomonadota bacterium]
MPFFLHGNSSVYSAGWFMARDENLRTENKSIKGGSATVVVSNTKLSDGLWPEFIGPLMVSL